MNASDTNHFEQNNFYEPEDLINELLNMDNGRLAGFLTCLCADITNKEQIILFLVFHLSLNKIAILLYTNQGSYKSDISKVSRTKNIFTVLLIASYSHNLSLIDLLHLIFQ